MGRSRKRAKERQQERKQRRQRLTLIGIGVGALVIAVVAILATRPAVVDVDEELLARYDGLPLTFTERGFPVLGNPEAPARLTEYSSFDCGACANFHENVSVNIIDRVRAGELAFTYVPVFGTGALPDGDRAAEAAVCAGEQGLFFEYHDLLFNWHQVNQAAAFTNSRIRAGAEALGMDMDEFEACRNSDRVQEVLDNARAAFSSSGAGGTPTILINGEEVSATLAAVNGQIDLIMAGADPVPVEIIADEPEAVDEA
ncbi:MAG: thioredoxin domain-containing protein, partial [Chloroflexota bacterium]